MPGTITFKPLAASLNINKKADPYCSFKLGDKIADGKPSGLGGQHPHWEDSVTFQVQDQARCFVELKDQKNTSPKGFIGNFEVDVREIESNGKLRKWFTVVNNDKSAGEILLEASYQADQSQAKKDISRAEENEKAPQGTLPASLDMEKTPFEFSKRSMEAANSLAKMAETNEFGDYQPEKQLFWKDHKREYGSGMIQHGNYYSGQQTSYGEDYPMAQKSVDTDHIPTIEEYGATISRGTNPTDYARWINQAFVPHNTNVTLSDNPSVVEQAYQTAKWDDLYKRGMSIPAVRLSKPVNYSANEGAYPNIYATERSLDEKGREFETSPISGRTFGSETQDTSRNESLGDIIAREQDISKGVLQPTQHGIPGDPDSDHTAFRDIKNTKREY